MVKLRDETDATLLVTWFPYLTEMFTFDSASKQQDFVLATMEADRYIFTDVDRNRFEWLADLKDLTAQWAASQLGRASIALELTRSNGCAAREK